MPLAISRNQTSIGSKAAPATLLGDIPAVAGRMFPGLSTSMRQAIEETYLYPGTREAATTCHCLATLLQHPSGRVRRQAEEALTSLLALSFRPLIGGHNDCIWHQPWLPEALEHILRNLSPRIDERKVRMAENISRNISKVPELSTALADAAIYWLAPSESVNDLWSSRAEAATRILSSLPPVADAVPALHQLATTSPAKTSNGSREAAAKLLRKWLAEGSASLRQEIAGRTLRFETESSSQASRQRLDLLVAAVLSEPSLLATEPVAAAVVERARSWSSLLAAALRAAGWMPSSLATILRRGHTTNWDLVGPWLESVTACAVLGNTTARETLALCTEEEVNLWLNSPRENIRKLAWLSLGETATVALT